MTLYRLGLLRFESFGQLEYIGTNSYALVDVDDNTSVPTITFINSICRIIGVTPKNYCYQRTRRGWHIIIELMEKLEHAELIAFQCILGDDPMRGALNLMRERNIKGANEFWKSRSNILYSGKEK